MSNYLRVLSSANRSGGGGDMNSTASISIPEAVSEDGVTYYVVRVDVDKVNWTVRHRFRDFAELHEVLKPQMPKPYNSMWEVYAEMIPALIKQSTDTM